jgi:hypothetical protein
MNRADPFPDGNESINRAMSQRLPFGREPTMKNQGMWLLKFFAVMILIAGSHTWMHALQFQNPIQAAKDAYNKAKQQQQKPVQPSPAPRQQPTPQQQQAAHATSTDTAPTPPPPFSDCCTPEALKRIAGTVQFVDIVGVKLGMTPAQAVAAIKAHNPNLQIETQTARMDDPAGAQGSFVKVPYVINANPPLVLKIRRGTRFPIGEPVVAANLLDSLRKKYGDDNYQMRGRGWVYDSGGKLLTRELTYDERMCVGDSPAGGPAGSEIEAQGHESGMGIGITSTELGAGISPGCNLVFATVDDNLATSISPNAQIAGLSVTLESGALKYGAQRATHEWLQGKVDAKLKKQSDDAKKRTGPEF